MAATHPGRRSDAQAAGRPGFASLIRIYPASLGEGIVELPHEELIVGRDPGCDLTVAGTDVSRRHACIWFDEPAAAYHVRDLESLNGTYVNDERVHQAALNAGDLLRIGKYIYKFLGVDDVERQYHETIYAMTITDGLTGAANKRYLLELLERELARSQRHHRPLSVALLDIDHFKRINDTYGHLAGDAVLRHLCSRINEIVRRDELLARFGGEEFVVILPESTREEALQFAERVRETVAAKPLRADETDIAVQVSIGVATTCGENDITPNALLERADARLYEAKRTGRNKVAG